MQGIRFCLIALLPVWEIVSLFWRIEREMDKADYSQLFQCLLYFCLACVILWIIICDPPENQQNSQNEKVRFSCWVGNTVSSEHCPRWFRHEFPFFVCTSFAQLFMGEVLPENSSSTSNTLDSKKRQTIFLSIIKMRRINLCAHSIWMFKYRHLVGLEADNISVAERCADNKTANSRAFRGGAEILEDELLTKSIRMA